MTTQPKPTLQLSERSEQRVLITGQFRLFTIAAFFMLCFLSVCVRLVNITVADRSVEQLWQHAWSDISSIKEDTVASMQLISGGKTPDSKRWKPSMPEVVMPRQTIRDRNGVLLATSVSTRSLYAKPQEIKDPDAVLRSISTIIPDLNTETLLRRLNSTAKFVWLKRHITPQEQETLLWKGIPGLYLHDDYTRIYPHGRLFSHVLGYTNVDGEGLSGAEKAFEDILRKDNALEPVTLSVDVRMQQTLLDVVEAQKHKHRAIAATGAIFHIPTAQARALISLPDYDPNRPMEATANARFNRLSVGRYELGSTFKTFSAALAMEHGDVRMNDGFDASKPMLINGKKIRDFHAKNRWMSVPEIFAYSSNIGTVKMMQTAGQEKQRDFLHHLGMFEATSLELQERTTPNTPDTWRPIQSATISYGHGISVTPLHLLQGMLVMTGGGQKRGLTILDDVVKDATPVMRPEVSQNINRLLRAVVQHGTARKANIEGYAVGGKTGTANKVIGNTYHKEKKISSMVAAFPMPNPEYLILVMLDEPQGTKDTFNFATAGWVAAPAVGDIVRNITPIIGMPATHFTPTDHVDRMIINAAIRAKNKRKRYVHNTSY